MKKLAIVSTHAIQYNAPWFRLLAMRNHIQIKVFYTWSQAAEIVEDRDFGTQIKWDIPLLDGYTYQFVKNTSKDPGLHHFFGLKNPSLISDITSFKPDAVLVFGWNFKSHLGVLRHFRGKIPVWFRGDSTLLDELPGIRTMVRRTALKGIYRYVDKALFVGSASKNYFLKHGLKSEQLIYAPHAIDNDRFSDDLTKNYKEQASRWRTELGISADSIVVLFAGKFESKKQPDILIRAVKSANASRKEALQLIILGQGALESELKLLAGNDPHIHFLPFQNQSKMPIAYRLGHVICLPSKGPGETWGLAINEAMASGLSVIVSDKVGCAEDLVQPFDNGYVFKHTDEDGLVEILSQLSLPQIKTMGANAQQIIQKWNFKAIVASIESNLY